MQLLMVNAVNVYVRHGTVIVAEDVNLVHKVNKMILLYKLAIVQ